MPKVKQELFGIHPRMDRKSGFQIVIPTEMKFVEEDGTDIRVERVRFYDERGELVKISLRDRMGVLFSNLEDVADDWQYFETHAPEEILMTTKLLLGLENA